MNEEELMLKAHQLRADIPEVTNELRAAINAHHQELRDHGLTLVTWLRVMKSVHHFIEIDMQISDLVAQAHEIRENEK
jgi:hypothetical protein